MVVSSLMWGVRREVSGLAGQWAPSLLSPPGSTLLTSGPTCLPGPGVAGWKEAQGWGRSAQSVPPQFFLLTRPSSSSPTPMLTLTKPHLSAFLTIFNAVSFLGYPRGWAEGWHQDLGLVYHPAWHSSTCSCMLVPKFPENSQYHCAEIPRVRHKVNFHPDRFAALFVLCVRPKFTRLNHVKCCQREIYNASF